MIAAIRAVALVDDSVGIEISRIIPESRRAEYQADLDELAAKIALKGATHSMRLIDVLITPIDPATGKELA